uniref:Peptidase S1 domain-containing protein n=1 Tax=Spermophilus dauricus TaxID=99837 RepID=A0A8C9UT75_SPEDA
MAWAGAKKSGLGWWGSWGLTALMYCLCFPALQAQDTEPNLSQTGIVSTVCGRNKLSPKIFGGKRAGPERWPWQAALLLRGKFICGAALIDSNWVASAAHCFQRSQNPADYRILLGYNQLSNPSNVSIQMTVYKVIVHPDFDKHHFLGSDITLMQLHQPVKFSSHILPACLPDSSTKPDSTTTCWISGWGMITEESFLPPPMQLQEAELMLVPSDVCDSFYRPPNPADAGPKPPGIHEDALCAGDYINERSICRVSKTSLDSPAELGHLLVAVLCPSIYVFFVPRAPRHHSIPSIFFSFFFFKYLFIYFSSRRTQHLCWYVVLRIEPRLHACQASALPLEPHPSPIPSIFFVSVKKGQNIAWTEEEI